jgi:hypothetical protein
MFDVTDPQKNTNARLLQTTISPTITNTVIGSTILPVNYVVADQVTPVPTSVGTSTILPSSLVVIADATSSPPVNKARWDQPTDPPTSLVLDAQQINQGGGGSLVEELVDRFFGDGGGVQENFFPLPGAKGAKGAPKGAPKGGPKAKAPKLGKPQLPGFPFKLKPILKPKPGKKKPKPGKRSKPDKKRKRKKHKKMKPELSKGGSRSISKGVSKFSHSKGESKGYSKYSHSKAEFSYRRRLRRRVAQSD